MLISPVVPKRLFEPRSLTDTNTRNCIYIARNVGSERLISKSEVDPDRPCLLHRLRISLAYVCRKSAVPRLSLRALSNGAFPPKVPFTPYFSIENALCNVMENKWSYALFRMIQYFLINRSYSMQFYIIYE